VDRWQKEPKGRIGEPDRNPHAIRYVVTLDNRITFEVDCEPDTIAGAVKPVMVARVFRTALAGRSSVELQGEKTGLWRFAAPTRQDAVDTACKALAEAFGQKVISVTPDHPKV